MILPAPSMEVEGIAHLRGSDGREASNSHGVDENGR